MYGNLKTGNETAGNITGGQMLKVLPSKEKIPVPGNIISVSIDNNYTTEMLEEAELSDSMIVVLGKKNQYSSDLTPESFYKFGCIAKVMQVIKLPAFGTKAVIRCLKRVRITDFDKNNMNLFARVEPVELETDNDDITKASLRILKRLYRQYLDLNPHIERPDYLINLDDEFINPLSFADIILGSLNLNYRRSQKMLEISDLKSLVNELHIVLVNEIEFARLEKKIEAEVTQRTLKEQKDYFLREKLKGLSSELGAESVQIPEVIRIREMKKNNELSEQAVIKADIEIEKLSKMHSMSPEYGLIRDYLELVISLPWKKSGEVNIDLNTAEKILDEDHYGLIKPKERILEYLSVLKLVEKLKSPILCFVGPPGTGKTSLGKSIARSLGRKYIRIALGGLHDEAEIRGHRKTYIGAMPGKIIQSLRKAGVNNPLILFDEIDKISSDFRGDPASALLEVLDPEQNNTFTDNYLDVEFDLSNVLFIATANDQNRIPVPLLDRMELIKLDGYIDPEKFMIASRFLIPDQKKANGINENSLKISDSAVYKIISEFTMEAGVRELERKIAKICRKTARMVTDDPEKIVKVNEKNLSAFLGIEEYKDFSNVAGKKIGEVNGLAWTISGGTILKVETNIIPGKPELRLTGKLGEVMKESAQAAFSYLRTNAELFEIDRNLFSENEIHIHFPEGATPKDGPSAGVTIVISMISAIKKIPFDQNIAMTGEITIHGDILAIGGLKTKLMAAKRSKISTVFIPQQNLKDLDNIDKEIKRSLNIIPVSHISEIITTTMKTQL
ncbi:TPA: endopeptidase La [Candidatus Delongbacteria bacterium]|nr:MAG: endopeptidase La [Candidatus Delongbacteria bacterium GWF2_40_14]HAQ62076.1 endopeptidase La [Candidatus Delongbacteria bacterium]